MKMLVVGLIILLLSHPTFGFGKPVPKTSEVKTGDGIIDNFETGKFSDWWTFGNISLQLVSGKNSRYALALTGSTRDWYIGGIGFYIGKDASKYSSLDMDVYGTGKDSGTLKIELYEDDNGNWQIEQDPNKGYAPIKDDRFVYELKVDWNGFKHISIPFSEFVDNNPESGDNVWNPQQAGGSGGLTQMQFIVSSTSKTGAVNLALDNIELR